MNATIIGEIEATLSKAAGHPITGVMPEFFLTETKTSIGQLGFTFDAYPHMKVLFVKDDHSNAMEVGEYGCN